MDYYRHGAREPDPAFRDLAAALLLAAVFMLAWMWVKLRPLALRN